MKKRLTRKQAAPRNVAARALGSSLFRPRIVKDPKAYQRRKLKPVPPPDDGASD